MEINEDLDSEIASMSSDEIRQRTRLIENDVTLNWRHGATRNIGTCHEVGTATH